MIVPSEFDALIQGGLSPVVLALQESFNGENSQPTYLFRQRLAKRYSIDGTYKNFGIDNGLIAADVIALDSPLPVKTRPAISTASGEIPKIGTELPMNETELKQLRLLKNAGGDIFQVSRLLFSDVRRVYGGVLEQLESEYLEGLSSGVIVRDTDNVGIGVRINFGYSAANQTNASVVWGSTGYAPITDVVSTLDKIDLDGKSAVSILLDRNSLNQILASDEAKALYGAVLGVAGYTTKLTMSQLNEVMNDNYGVEFEVINRSVTFEVNGVKKAVKPWKAGQVIFLTQDQVGTLVYSDVEEMSAPVGGVTYATAEDMVLIAQYRTARPSLRQYTSSQAVALPVIDKNVVYKLDTTAIA